MKTTQTPGVRHDFKTDQWFPTINGIDTSPSSFSEEEALRTAQKQCEEADKQNTP